MGSFLRADLRALVHAKGYKAGRQDILTNLGELLETWGDLHPACQAKLLQFVKDNSDDGTHDLNEPRPKKKQPGPQ